MGANISLQVLALWLSSLPTSCIVHSLVYRLCFHQLQIFNHQHFVVHSIVYITVSINQKYFNSYLNCAVVHSIHLLLTSSLLQIFTSFESQSPRHLWIHFSLVPRPPPQLSSLGTRLNTLSVKHHAEVRRNTWARELSGLNWYIYLLFIIETAILNLTVAVYNTTMANGGKL